VRSRNALKRANLLPYFKEENLQIPRLMHQARYKEGNGKKEGYLTRVSIPSVDCRRLSILPSMAFQALKV
jgi:hypothetical protein